MGDDRMTVRVHVSAVEDAIVVHNALSDWLGESNITRETSPSHHGPTMVTLSADLQRNVDLRRAVDGLGPNLRSQVCHSLHSRMDDAGGLHFRLDLDALLNGAMMLAPPGGSRSVKVRYKVAVYPGQTPEARILDSFADRTE
jgi:RNA binding exosome subunit